MSDALERAIVSFVVQGEGLVNAATDRIDADLSSVERAGKSAESASRSADEAAKKAEQSSRQLAAGISATLSRLTQAAHVVRQVADLAGVDHDSRAGIGITAVQQGLAGAASGASLGAAIGSVVPGVGNAAGAVIGGVIGGGIGALHSINEAEKRIEEAAKRGAQKAMRESSGRDTDDAIGSMLREAGLAKFSNHTYGGSRG